MTSASGVVVVGIVSVGGAGAGGDKDDDDAAVVLAFVDCSTSFSTCFSLSAMGEFGSVDVKGTSSMSGACARDKAMHGTSLRTSFDRNEEFERVLDDFGLDGFDAVPFVFSPLASDDLGRA